LKKVLVDTSAWIELFRGGPFPLADQVNTLVLEDRALLCGAVEFELLSGARREERQLLESKLAELEYHEFERRDHHLAARLFKKMQALGRTLKYADLMIAAFCIERDLLLLTLDSDFEGIPGLNRLHPNKRN
jgi:predicted nucleic acid-binding protein